MELTEVKSSLFGYKKNDVVRYISELNELHTAAIEAKTEEYAEFKSKSEKEIVSVVAQNKALTDKIESLEEKVAQLDYVAEACACQGYDENGKPYVKLVVALNDKEADEEAIKEKLMTYCKENFEGYGCPRHIFVVPELPRTKMEKIDFVKLSDPVPQAK